MNVRKISKDMTYQAPIDDMLFCMKELAGLDATARLQGLEEVMPETAQACAKFTQIVIAPLNAAGGQNPAALADGSVSTLPGFKWAYLRLMEEGCSPPPLAAKVCPASARHAWKCSTAPA
ncbi:hypothetical protein P245_27595 [Comamonas thiooxydans]|uniref:Uncharacterized protein n=1 Tax=Comamonas thiooxydans TaxID=363952 RepID=A0A0E3BUE0_9BURK|nr:hypothetical protein P245_27595 [Comamonas thiooxydans]